jgi:heme-degrading monooxygenase HmoA
MIARTWSAQATAANAADYARHFATHVAPRLLEIAGHRGAYLLRRDVDGRVEFLAVTLWDAIETVKGFAGADPTVAIVEPEGRAVLASFDPVARHYDIAYSSVGGR